MGTRQLDYLHRYIDLISPRAPNDETVWSQRSTGSCLPDIILFLDFLSEMCDSRQVKSVEAAGGNC